MSENDDFTHVQRRLCAVIAKSEWTSSRMRMQKSGEELRESRAKSNRTANQFLQDLLGKRTDGELTDDNGALDRYHKFVKYKSKHDDSTNTLDEFDRRLRALNANRQNQTTNKFNNENSMKIPEKKLQLQINNQFQIDQKDILKPVSNTEKSKSSRILPNVSINPITSTPNDTTNELIHSGFPDEDIQELSHVHSENQSLNESQITNSIQQSQTVSLEKNETINSSTSSLNQSLSPILHTPKVRRFNGTEYLSKSIRTSLPRASSDVLLFHHCHFPRSLTSRGKLNNNNHNSSSSKRQLPILPNVVQLNEQKQFYPEKIYDLLDHLDENFQENFTKKLDELVLTNVSSRIDNETPIQIEEFEQIEEDNEKEFILPNFFSQTIPIEQEKRFYSIFHLTLNNCQNLCLYTMTFSTVQLTGSLLLPYSILNGRRPVLKSSNQTNFKRILSKQSNSTYQITAIEDSLNIPEIQQNDIILKIDDQSVWGLTVDVISNLLKCSNSCSLTLVRLCQPLL